MKKLATILLIAISIFLGKTPSMAEAQVANAQCLGQALGDYMNTLYQEINDRCGGLSNIQLLSPAWNMTNNVSFSIISSTSFDWSQLDGIAGNAYDFTGESGVLDHVNRFMSSSGMPNKPIFLTETGIFRSGNQDRFRNHLSQIKTGSAAGYSFLGAAFFAPFEGLGGPEWAAEGFNLTDTQIRDYCGDGGCNNLIGFNSATFYPNVDDSYYQRASNIPMGTTVSIANLDSGNLNEIAEVRNEKGFTPVVRIGDATRTNIDGLEADTYAQFLCDLDGAISGTVYAIAGPNEPQSECWFAPACGSCGTTVNFGENRRPINFDDGFWLGKYDCDETTDPEFHALRPYPASPCDMLIPRAIPQAPGSPASPDERGTWKKYLNYACGSNITYSTLGSFDPYGRDDDELIYSSLDTAQENPFLLTYCEPRTNWDGYETVTCYRTVKFNISMDFSNASVGILGNTQLTELTPVLKANNYLAYYWGGIPGTAENAQLNMNDPEDRSLIVDYSGPIQKLLPSEAQESMRIEIIEGREEVVHNYMIEDESNGSDDGVQGGDGLIGGGLIENEIRLGDVGGPIRRRVFSRYMPNVPLGSVEDMAGEVFFTGIGGSGPVGVDPETGLTTSPYQFTVTCGVGAHQVCP